MTTLTLNGIPVALLPIDEWEEKNITQRRRGLAEMIFCFFVRRTMIIRSPLRHRRAGTLHGASLREADSPRSRERDLTLRLLRTCCGLQHDSDYCHTPDGIPYIQGSPLHISVSHSRAEVGVAWSSDRMVGIDIEQPREALRRVAQRFLTPREQAYYTTLPLLLRAWTIKEAVYKAMQQKKLTSAEIQLSCREPRGDTDFARVGDVTLTITLHQLPSGSLLALAAL